MTVNKSSQDHNLPAEIAAPWRADAVRKSQRPEEFWTGQETRIRARIRSQAARKPRPLWLAGVTAALVFLVVLLVSPARPRPQHPTAQATVDPDQELLLAVERALAAGTPEALEPLTLFVESGSNHNEADNISHKEHRNED